MRIAGGQFRGRNLLVPKGLDVRPTQDRVREALFNMLQGALEGARFLDLFAGSGAVGLEAISRGAAEATLVELAPRHVACIEANVATLGVGAAVRVVRADVASYLNLWRKGQASYTLAFADPPYDLGLEKGYAQILRTLAEKDIVSPEGLFVAEMRYRQDPDVVAGWEICRDRVYGQSRLVVYRRSACAS